MSVLYDSFAHPSSADGQQHKIFQPERSKQLMKQAEGGQNQVFSKDTSSSSFVSFKIELGVETPTVKQESCLHLTNQSYSNL